VVGLETAQHHGGHAVIRPCGLEHRHRIGTASSGNSQRGDCAQDGAPLVCRDGIAIKPHRQLRRRLQMTQLCIHGCSSRCGR
jgi:hypothetical protein